MHEAVDRGQCGHLVFENLIPLRKDEVGTDHDAAALIAFGQECEEHLHFLSVLLHIADIVENDDLVAVEFFEFRFQAQVTLGREQLPHELEGGTKKHTHAVAQNQLPSQSSQKVRLAPARQSKSQNIGRAGHKSPLQERGQLPPDYYRQPGLLEVAQRFSLRQTGLGKQAGNAALIAFVRLALAEMFERLAVAPASDSARSMVGS